jgi:hypothetical protein
LWKECGQPVDRYYLEVLYVLVPCGSAALFFVYLIIPVLPRKSGQSTDPIGLYFWYGLYRRKHYMKHASIFIAIRSTLYLGFNGYPMGYAWKYNMSCRKIFNRIADMNLSTEESLHLLDLEFAKLDNDSTVEIKDYNAPAR